MRKLIFILTSIVLLAAGCERKFLIEPGHHHGNEIYLEIDLDEPLDEEVRTKDNPDMYKELLSTARSITVIAYPVDEHGYYGVHKINGLEGSIWLMPGKYDLMIYTSDFFDLDGTFYRGTTDPEAMEAFTNQVKSSKTKYNMKVYYFWLFIFMKEICFHGKSMPQKYYNPAWEICCFFCKK